MKPDQGSLVRAIVYGVALIYLFLDLFVAKGPLYHRIRDSNPRSERVIAEETARGVVARVFYQPILLTQVDRAVERKLWLRGKSPRALTDEALRLERMAALNEIFEEHLLRTKVRFNPDEFSVSEQEVIEAVKTFKKRFSNETLLNQAIANQGWDGEKELVARIRAKLEQEAYLANQVASSLPEDKLLAYYEEYRSRFSLPERLNARHIFFAALEHPNGEAAALAQSALQDLATGEDFATLAAKVSEDPATKNQGGNLNWMSRNRLPEDLAGDLFTLPVGGYHLVQSSLGAHVVEVLAKKPARERTFEEVKAELQDVLSNQRRERGTKEYLSVLHHRDSNKLEIFSEVLNRPWSLQTF